MQFHEWTMAKTVGIALLDLILLNSYAHHFSFILKISYHLRALSKFKETFNENQVHFYHTYSFFSDFCSIIFGV